MPSQWLTENPEPPVDTDLPLALARAAGASAKGVSGALPIFEIDKLIRSLYTLRYLE